MNTSGYYKGVVTNVIELEQMTPERLARNFAKLCRDRYYVLREPTTHRGLPVSQRQFMGVDDMQFITMKGRKSKLQYKGEDTGDFFDLNNKDDYANIYCALGRYIDKTDD